MTILNLTLTWLNTLFHQLWLSISSVQFYKDVYKNYTGYGIKYLFIVSSIPAVIYSVFILNYIATLEDYFAEGKISKRTERIEYVINQFPEMQYDGKNLTLPESGVVYLYTRKKNKIIAIDLDNQLAYKEKIKIPLIFNSDRLSFNLKDLTKTTIEYSKILNSTSQTLNPAGIKQYCAYFFTKAPTIFIYIGVPFVILVWFSIVLFERSLLILVMYILTNLFGPKSSMQTCMRLVFFSSGISVMVQPILMLVAPKLGNIAAAIQIFAVILLFRALAQMRNSGA